mmetsp:Transcript_10606/g.23147  ORF Transcript_10606/g.23147 Transcript_10606/m.23147 type:complete len:226 (-) Transcript_10606:238-915(-)
MIRHERNKDCFIPVQCRIASIDHIASILSKTAKNLLPNASISIITLFASAMDVFTQLFNCRPTCPICPISTSSSDLKDTKHHGSGFNESRSSSIPRSAKSGMRASSQIPKKISITAAMEHEDHRSLVALPQHTRHTTVKQRQQGEDAITSCSKIAEPPSITRVRNPWIRMAQDMSQNQKNSVAVENNRPSLASSSSSRRIIFSSRRNFLPSTDRNNRQNEKSNQR